MTDKALTPPGAAVPRSVVFLHGVEDWGRWFAATARALGPGFVCDAIRYRGYLVLGFLKPFVWTWGLVLVSLVVGVCFKWEGTTAALWFSVLAAAGAAIWA